MKVLFSHYMFLLNELSSLAFELGFKGNLSLHLCKFLKLKGRPIYPARTVITTPEMKKLVHLAQECYTDLFYFVKVLGI